MKTDMPQVAALKEAVEAAMGLRMKEYGDFAKLGEKIWAGQHEMLSESTLERVWGYSTRGYESISGRTLNILSRVVGKRDWEDFCQSLREKDESGIFADDGIRAADLQEGARLRIGWMPDRIVVARHLGSGKFEVEESENAKLKQGNIFTCSHFQKGQALHADLGGSLYVAGKEHGITTLELI